MSLNMEPFAPTAILERPRGLLSRVRRALRAGRSRDRGSIGVMIAVGIPALTGFGALAIDGAYTGYRTLLLRQTVQAAALAGANKLPTYFSSGTGSTATVTSTAQTFATANMPTASYGTAVTSVVVGNWNASTKALVSLATSHGTNPDAVEVTGSTSVPLFFGSLFGRSSVTLASTVIASLNTGQTFNTIVINDMSQSFTSELAAQKAVDTSVLNCVKGAAGSTSQFGITLMNGHSTTYQALSAANANQLLLQTKITALTALACGLNCGTGSNVAAAIYSAIQQFSGSTFANTKKNIVIITDGVPNADNSVDYERADGIYPTSTASTPTCIGVNNCNDSDLLTMARNQATAANAAGISVSTIYYSGSTPTAQQSSFAASLQSLVKGSGVAMVAPTSAAINAAFAGFCATMPSTLKTVM
jgi:Flp pilus assembly protein TadG